MNVPKLTENYTYLHRKSPIAKTMRLQSKTIFNPKNLKNLEKLICIKYRILCLFGLITRLLSKMF